MAAQCSTAQHVSSQLATPSSEERPLNEDRIGRQLFPSDDLIFLDKIFF